MRCSCSARITGFVRRAAIAGHGLICGHTGHDSQFSANSSRPFTPHQAPSRHHEVTLPQRSAMLPEWFWPVPASSLAWPPVSVRVFRPPASSEQDTVSGSFGRVRRRGGNQNRLRLSNAHSRLPVASVPVPPCPGLRAANSHALVFLRDSVSCT